jgi:hypothetical protein
MKKKMERKCFNQLSRKEKIFLYLYDHPECLTQELMDEVATRFLSVGYIRRKVKTLYNRIVLAYLIKDNFILTPDHYEEE